MQGSFEMRVPRCTTGFKAVSTGNHGLTPLCVLYVWWLWQNSKIKFNIYAANTLESYAFQDGLKIPLIMSKKVDPCTTVGAELGVYDLVYCSDQLDTKYPPGAHSQKSAQSFDIVVI